MIKALAAAGAFLAMMLTPEVTGAAQRAKPVEVMVLGTWHFDNPGLDLYNAKADDVRTERRQAELRVLADALASFKPTKVMVELAAKTPDLVDAGYAAFTPVELTSNRNEAVQIGYRVARQLGHPQVYAIDVQGPFPFDKVAAFAKAKGKEEQLAAVMRQAAEATKQFERDQPTSSIPALLSSYNRPDGFQSSISGYYGILGLGDAVEQPGAELNAAWYLRNARIWSNLMRAAEPGDRILVVYGAGHNYWLRHFASETPGYRNVDPLPFLSRAAAAR